MFKTSPFKNHNWIITGLAAILSTIGIITIFSTTYNAQNVTEGQGLFKKQLILLSIGFSVYFLITFFDYRWFKDPKFLATIYIFTILLLIYVKIFTPAISNTNRWIKIGPLTIQPAEYAKITLILITSSLLSNINQKESKYFFSKNIKLPKFIKKFIKNHTYLCKVLLCLLLAIPIITLILIQPAFGNTGIITFLWFFLVILLYPNKKELAALLMIFLITFLLILKFFLSSNTSLFLIIMLITIGINLVYWTLKPRLVETIIILIISILTVPAGSYVWKNIMKDYQKERVEIFLDPTKDPQGAGWQVKQSKIAIGAGRIFGRGYMQGTQSGLKLLPYPHTDFIFAAFAEQFGFIRSLILIILLLSLPLTIFSSGDKLQDDFANSLSLGVGTLLLIHIFINIGMNLGKLPVTGIPLPLISYGGSSIIVTMLCLGIVQNTLKFGYIQENVKRIGYR